MNNTAILQEYEKVTGVKATTNTFRKQMEPIIQSDQAMKTRSKDISSHSENTGRKYYDASGSQFRASSMHFINDVPAAATKNDTGPYIPEEVAAKRMKMDEEGQRIKVQNARKTLLKDPANRNVTLGPNCRVPPGDRQYLQEAFAKGGTCSSLNLYAGKFPGMTSKCPTIELKMFSFR